MSHDQSNLHQISRRNMLRVSGSAVSAAAATALFAHQSTLLANLRGSTAAVEADLPNDSRLGDLKDLNGYFPFSPSETPADWEIRSEYVRRQILVAAGLWPMPPRPAIQATVHGRVKRDGYTVDRVFFESSPGLLVTGSLYRPAVTKGRLPTILCPHGHWANGRFHDHGEQQIRQELASGGEQFEAGGRHPLQARSVQLARMGCMVFLYDMLGYGDGGSASEALAHHFSTQRPEMSKPDQWGLFSAQSELRLLNILGLQTWNSVRALDWLISRDDCDAERIGMTGASGGGSQTFLLTAIDDRVKAAFPAVMVSTAMQGGCTCENACYLRVNTGNIEFAALAAPRPVYMTGANDWTVEIETKGLPELKQHYEMLGVADRVHAKHYPFPHNYNWPSRMMMYRFFNKFLNLGFQNEQIVERDFIPLKREEATVFNQQHPAPPQDEQQELKFLRAWDATSNQQLAELAPRDESSLTEFRRIVGGALEIMIGRGLPSPNQVEYEKLTEEDQGSFTRFTARLRLPQFGEEIPAVFLNPADWNQQVVLWLDGNGKAGLFQADGSVIAPVAALVSAGFAVGSIDLLYTGDFTEDGQPISQTRTVKNTREFAGYTLGYNHPLFSQRTHDVLSLLSFAVNHSLEPRAVHLVGVHGAGPIAAAACAIAAGTAASLAVDTVGFRFASITSVRDLNLLPGMVKYGDVPALLALCAPTKLSVVGESAENLSLMTASYSSAGTVVTYAATVSELAQGIING